MQTGRSAPSHVSEPSFLSDGRERTGTRSLFPSTPLLFLLFPVREVFRIAETSPAILSAASRSKRMAQFMTLPTDIPPESAEYRHKRHKLCDYE